MSTQSIASTEHSNIDPIWSNVRRESELAVQKDPLLGAFFYATVLNHSTLEGAVVHRIAQRLDHGNMGGDVITQAFEAMAEATPQWSNWLRVDMQAVFDRDPACTRFVEPLLYFKGFHALQTHRLAHWMWNEGRRDFALYLQSRSSAVFQCDINPAAPIGKGIFLDHATGLVVGATASIADNVSILHGVTLGGTGKEGGDRHPKIKQGVLIGAGAKILGNIEVGECAKVASGSVVLHPVPPRTTVAGVPAKVVGESGCDQPSQAMNQLFSGEFDI